MKSARPLDTISLAPPDGADRIAGHLADRVATTAVMREALFWPMAVLSLKLSLAMLAPVLMSLYVARLVARQGDLVFSGYSVVTSLNTVLFIVASSFLQVLFFLGGRALGSGDHGAYRAAMSAGVRFALGAGVVATALSALAGPLLGSLGFDAGLVSLVQWQGLAAAVGLLPPMLLVVYRIHASLQRRAGFISVLATAGALGSGALAAAVVYTGSAEPAQRSYHVLLALAAVNWLMLAAAFAVLRAPGSTAGGSPDATAPMLAPVVPAWREMWSYGWPIGAVVLMDTALTFSATLAMGRWWIEVLPVHSAIVLWLSLGLIVPLGIAQAGVQNVAIAHARGDIADRNRAAAAALVLAAFYGVAVALLLPALALQAGALLLPGSELSAVTQQQLRQLMLPAGIVLAAEGVIVIAAALLRGIGQTRAPLIQALVGCAVFGVGGQALFAIHFGLGAVGLWWGLVLGFGVTATAVTVHCITRLGLHRRTAA